MISLAADPGLGPIFAEVQRVSADEACSYLLGAAHDGTVNRLHATLRVTQADQRWLDVLRAVLERLGKRSWIYREGVRPVWTLETTYRPEPIPHTTDAQRSAYARGYFDAEGGVPRDPQHRFYVQFVQKDKEDLALVRVTLCDLGIQTGRIHNPSAVVDPGYWRFYIASSSWSRFIDRVGSWHPRKRAILDERRSRCVPPPEQRGERQTL